MAANAVARSPTWCSTVAALSLGMVMELKQRVKWGWCGVHAKCGTLHLSTCANCKDTAQTDSCSFMMTLFALERASEG